MKNILLSTFTVICSMLLLPLSALKGYDEPTKPTASKVAAAAKDNIEYENPSNGKDIFRILIKETGKVSEISADDYITGVVAAEMPALYEEEALKAQAVAAYTYACRKREKSGEKEYDLTDDPDSDQCYIDEAKMRERWGQNADKYIEKVTSAVKAVSRKYLEYDGAPALTVYHAVSSGNTENCKDVWGSALPYLVSVESLGDRLEENYLSTLTLTSAEMSKKLSALCDTTGDAKDWFGEPQKTDTGRVKSIKVCGNELTGVQLADALTLNSANFVISLEGDTFTVEVRGRGHGVGMSQYGANYMAKEGKNYEEILLHYYQGCKIKILTNS